MRTSFIALAAVLAMGGTGAQAQMRALSDPVIAAANPEALFTSGNAQLNRNKQAAMHIEKELLQCHQWSRAGEWLTGKYIQHNPMAASGLAGVQNYFINVAKQQPTPTCDKLTVPVVAVVAEGDYVTVLTVRELDTPGLAGTKYTTTWFDTWRFVGGKADEHWDPMTLPAPAPRAEAARPAGTEPAAFVRPIGGRFIGTDVDRAAIQDLEWHYDRSLDNYDADTYVNSFTPDGAFGKTKGREALRTMVLGFQKNQDDRRA